jgi:hypothetical protein
LESAGRYLTIPIQSETAAARAFLPCDIDRHAKYSQAVTLFKTRLLRVMPHWVLKCPECKIHFTHSEVHIGKEDYGLWLLPSKPEFPQGGSWLECPNCKKTSLLPTISTYVRGNSVGEGPSTIASLS